MVGNCFYFLSYQVSNSLLPSPACLPRLNLKFLCLFYLPVNLVSNASSLGKPEVPHLPSSASGEATQTFGQHIANRHLASLKVTDRFSTLNSELVPDPISRSQFIGKRQMAASCLHPRGTLGPVPKSTLHRSSKATVPAKPLFHCPASLSFASGLIMVSCLNCPSFLNILLTMRTGVFFLCAYICTSCIQRSGEGVRFPGTELQMDVRCRMKC